MKKLFLLLTLFFCLAYAHSQKHLIINATGYGFDRNSTNGVNPDVWDYIQKFTSLTYNGQDASATAVRLHIQWEQYEPTLGNYNGAKLAQAVAAIRALKPGMKVALHFPYMRNGSMNDSYFSDDEIARIEDGTKVQNEIAYTCPSIFSESAKAKFYAFVNDALNAVSPYYSDILYVKLGNASAEEYHIPHHEKNNHLWPGFFEDAAVQAFRTQYLPCRYPGQSSVVWDGNTQTLATANSYKPGMWGNWNSDHAREYHRFGAWGLMKFFTGFRDIAKSKSSSIKVIYFVSHFGSPPGSYLTLTNATLPRALNESDGIYTSDNDSRKISSIDVLKGTNINKIAAIEFDPDDVGQQQNPTVIGINPNTALEWMTRAYKHGADYVHIAMHFADSEIAQLAPVLANIRANYVNGSYTAPARQQPISENIVPKIFTGDWLFTDAWANNGGGTWASSDLNPVSINMTDNGYWENIWSCSSNPCDYTVSASGPSGSVGGGSSVTLNSTITGQSSGVSYSWSGTGISGSNTNASVTFPAPATAGTYTYTLTTSKNGCTNKTATVQVVVGAACDFNLTASNSVSGSNLSLTSSCSGANCSGVTYAWSGNGASGSSSSTSVTKPTTAGTYTYTITASKSGCSNKTATTTYTVEGGGGSLDQCIESENADGNGPVTGDPNASNGNTRGAENNNNHYVEYTVINVPSAGNYTATLTYYSSSAPTVGVQVNGGSTQTINLPSSGSWNIVRATHSFTVALNAGSNTIRISGTGGGSCRQDKLCVVGSGSGGGGCTTPAAPTLNASPSTITTSGGSSTLTASGCVSGGTITWSTGSTNSSISVSPTSTTTYTATCSKDGCTSSQASVVVTVDISGTPPSYNQCKESELSTGTGAISSDPNASNGETRGEQGNYNHYVDYALTSVPAAGTYYVTLTYYSSSAPTVEVKVNGGSAQTANLSNSGSWNIVRSTHQFSVSLQAGANTIRITGTGGGSCRQDKICVSNTSGSSSVLGLDPAEINTLKVLSVAPNPSKGTFQTDFYLEKGKKATIIISDLQGRIIYRQSVVGHGQHREKINLLNKASGTLILQLQKENGIEVKKINIAR